MIVELLVLLAVGPGAPASAEESRLAGLEVSGDASCPTAAQVTQSLGRLHPGLDARGWHLELSTDASTSFHMGVRDPSNALIGERQFIGLSDCTQRAEAVAATLAVWLGELAAQPLSPPVYPEIPKPSPAPETQNPPALAANHPAPTVPARRWQIELGAAALGSIDQTGAGAAGINLSAWVRPQPRHWGLQAHLEWAAPRTLHLGSGFADWQRATLATGAHYLLERGWGGLELEANLVAGLTVTQGRGLTVPRLDAGLEPGFFAGARFFADPRPAWRGWVSAGLAIWPVRQQVGLFSGATGTPSAVATLPQLEVLLALGGSWLD